MRLAPSAIWTIPALPSATTSLAFAVVFDYCQDGYYSYPPSAAESKIFSLAIGALSLHCQIAKSTRKAADRRVLQSQRALLVVRALYLAQNRTNPSYTVPVVKFVLWQPADEREYRAYELFWNTPLVDSRVTGGSLLAPEQFNIELCGTLKAGPGQKRFTIVREVGINK
ncbi:hypothetical protein GQ54DRAFT_301161 [Martensiomyces pterosporus]|nr:hypothetical protein GQ54DRAFT_301161 [Martensiomyces pterosporus]